VSYDTPLAYKANNLLSGLAGRYGYAKENISLSAIGKVDVFVWSVIMKKQLLILVAIHWSQCYNIYDCKSVPKIKRKENERYNRN